MFSKATIDFLKIIIEPLGFFGGVFYWLVGFIVLWIIGWLFVNWLRNFFHTHTSMANALEQVIYQVSLPRSGKDDEENKQPPKSSQEELAQAENLFAVIAGLPAQKGFKAWLLGRTDILSFEIVLQNEQIYFYFVCPKYLAATLEQQIYASYPKAYIEKTEDYNIFHSVGQVVGAYIKLKRNFILPIKTFRKFESDPLESVLSSLSKLPADQSAAVQFVVRSSHARWHNKSFRVARDIQKGKKIKTDSSGVYKVFDGIGRAISFLAKFFKSDKRDAELEPYKLSPLEEEMVKGIEEKAAKAGLDVNLRLIVSAKSAAIAESSLTSLANAFAQYNIYRYGNAFKLSRKNIARLISDFIHRSFRFNQQMLLNSEEMASLFHLPLVQSQVPKVHWLEARKAPAPVNLPKEGIVLGENDYRGMVSEIRIKKEDRQRHMYIIGKSGTGKSYFQVNMAIQDIKNGDGICVIDPHGELIEDILTYIPKERIDDVIYFDPSDFDRPMAMNMLEFNTPEQKTFVVNELINIFDKLYDLKTTGGPMFEQYMRNALLLVMEDPESGSTLMEVPKVLADANFRRYKLSKCNNPVVHDFWTKEAEKAGGEAALANMVPYITSKLTPFVASDLMRPIIAQSKSSFSFREAMDSQKILLINLAKGKIGDMSSHLLGMIIIGKILFAALSRAEMPADLRKDFYLYIDEFQNYTTDSIAIILSEARKYHLCLTIAHQYINQLVKNNDTRIRDSVFGNVGTLVSFRIGPDDAPIIAKQFAPIFNEFDVINVPQYNAYIKLLIDNQNAPAFNFRPVRRSQGNLEYAEKIKQLSRLKYGRDRAIVEAEIKQRVSLASLEVPSLK